MASHLGAEELQRAVRLQRKSYAMLRWFQDELAGVTFPGHDAHAAMDERAAARHWIAENLWRMPESVAPSSDELDEVAALFASYLTTSFDFDEDPDPRLVSECGCFCPICTRMVQSPHLRPKRLAPGDKHRARLLKIAAVTELAAGQGRTLAEEQVLLLLADRKFSEQAALVAYASQLLLRLAGDPGDPSLLALWREFAWTATGAPKKGFELDARDVLDAEDALAARLRDA